MNPAIFHIRSKPAKRVIKALLLIAAAALGICFTTDIWVRHSAKGRIYHNITKVPHCETAIVLGTKCLPGGKLSPRLATRCDKAIELYKAGKVDKLLMSGDNREFSNNEPDSMRRYAINHGVSKRDIIVDPEGFRTYDSMYRAKHVYGFNQLIVVTQEFHLARSIFFCKSQKINAYGVSADLPGTFKDTVREPMARVLALIDVYVRKSKP